MNAKEKLVEELMKRLHDEWEVEARNTFGNPFQYILRHKHCVNAFTSVYDINDQKVKESYTQFIIDFRFIQSLR
jgi:hypothetical protein